MKSELDRLALYRRMLVWFESDNAYGVGFCAYMKNVEKLTLYIRDVPELFSRRTTHAIAEGQIWYSGRHERIKALKSSIRELRWKIWISRVSTMLCLSKRTDSTR